MTCRLDRNISGNMSKLGSAPKRKFNFLPFDSNINLKAPLHHQKAQSTHQELKKKTQNIILTQAEE